MIKTVSLETAKALKEAGFKKESVWSWTTRNGSTLQACRQYFTANEWHTWWEEIIAAPTTDELLEELPDHIDFYWLEIGRNDGYECSYYHCHNGMLTNKVYMANELPEALAAMWLWLKKEGLLNVK